MRFSAEWQDPGLSASVELKATFCLLAIDIEERRVSRFFDDRYGRAHDRIAMPAYPAAQGFTRAWWSLPARRSGTIRLRQFRDGFAAPDIRLAQSEKPRMRSEAHGSIRVQEWEAHAKFVEIRWSDNGGKRFLRRPAGCCGP
jgi:hypothetical protein